MVTFNFDGHPLFCYKISSASPKEAKKTTTKTDTLTIHIVTAQASSTILSYWALKL